MDSVNRNKMLNLLKGLACIGVVFMHITFPGKIGEVIKYMSAYAVPIFFLIAGYYSFGKNEDIIKKRLLKIIKIFLFAYIIFFLLNVLNAVKNHEIVQWFRDNYNITSIAKYVFFCTIGFAIPLWYLLAQIETYIFWFFTIKLKKEDFVVKMIPLMFALQVLLTTICETMQFDWFWKINFVTMSLSWFALGFYIHSMPKEKIEKHNNSVLSVVGMIGLAVVLAPVLFDLEIKFSSIGYILYSTSLFIIALKNADKSLCKPLEYVGDKLSLWIYVFHVPASAVIKIVVQKLFRIDTKVGIYSWFHPLITVCVVIIISYVFNFIIQKMKDKRITTV